MDTTTPTEVHFTIVEALGNRARIARKEAASHRLSGPANSERRAQMRAHAELCEYLQRILNNNVSPEALAALLAAKAV